MQVTEQGGWPSLFVVYGEHTHGAKKCNFVNVDKNNVLVSNVEFLEDVPNTFSVANFVYMAI